MSGILSSLSGIATSMASKVQGIVDRLFPPEKRAEWMTRLQAFAVSNPKLAGFLLTNFALTGLPLLLFIVFTITVFVFSLVAALLVGVLAALAFTVFMVGIALIIILPTVFMTTMGATFLFLWGLGGYYIVKWFNEDSGPAAEGEAIGDKLNALTGGKMSFLMDGARKKEAGEFDDVGGDGVSDIKDKAGEGVGGAMDGVKQRAGKGGGEKGEQQSEKKAEKEEANGGAKD